MPRSIWNGAISFGLVNVPVQLFSATESKEVHFHNVSKSGHRIRNKRVDEKTGREVEYKSIVKGYELSKGKTVIIEPEELEVAAPKQTRAIEIEDFVDLAEIDPIYYDATYYLAPKGDAAGKSYALLREAMTRTERVGIGRFVMRTKQYLVAIRPDDDLLVLHTMYFADEIRDPSSLDVPPKLRNTAKELKIAEQLIESQTIAWDPERYGDTYREEVLKIIRKKSKGQEIVVAEPEEQPAQVLDLVEALQKSLDAKKPKKRRRRAS
jgi:DNA end-binding protein Ku